ncbi:MAG: response regulator, partial [Gammaproteobacteria bacterium]|nr:response regulator [Gammaproteobacteria bacterium]
MTSPLVYLVEDSEMLSMLYQDYLRAESYDIRAFRFGKEGLDALKEQPPQVLLLDLELPDMDGMDLLRYVSEQGLPTSVVVITAHGSVDIAVEAMRHSAFDFLTKPFDGKRLCTTVR